MKTIDIHTHAFPDQLAAKVVRELSQQGGIKYYANGTIDGLKESMHQAGIELSVLYPVATKPQQVVSINNWAINIEDASIISLGAMHPDFDRCREEIERIHQAGLKGIKLHPQYQDFQLDGPRLYRIYELLVEFDMILSLHMGGDEIMLPPYAGTPEKLAHVLDDFPGLKVIAAHMGGYDQWDAVEEHLVGRELFLETSFGLGFIPDHKFLQIVRAHGADKVLFGSDSPWRPQKEDICKLMEVGLTETELNQIRRLNAVKLLQLNDI
jgi:uncharacterized protein